MSLDPRTPVVVAARRTPIGVAGHALRELAVDELAAPVVRALVEDLPERLVVDEVVLGNCLGPGGNLARVTALRAGLPTATAARTIDLQCGSGLAAIVAAADSIRSGRCDVVVAGGAESASTAPTRTWPGGQAYARAPFAPPGHPDPDMGEAADELARRAGISRARADRYAARSFSRAWAAQVAGTFEAELVALPQLSRDERVREGMTEARLSRLRPSFAPDGTVTAGNATGINDGAALVAVVSEEVRARLGLSGLAVVEAAQRGCDPALPGLGPVPAVQALRSLGSLRPFATTTQLRSCGEHLEPTTPDPDAHGNGAHDNGAVDWARIDRVEVNEAFAAQVLACCDALGLDEERVCPDGGALALGHPWGASGALLVVRLFSALARQGHGRRGLAAIAVGGGQGVAMLLERVDAR